MTIWEAALLGVVQGITEFLPISSDGHLALMHHLLGMGQLDLTFDVFLHGMTLLAIIIFFWKDIWKLSRQEMVGIALGTVPAVVVGLFIKDYLEPLSASLLIVGGFLMVTGVMNLFADRCLSRQKEGTSEVAPRQALVIGLFQAFAILPGVSRSGGTVASAVAMGVDRQAAFRFSFLLGIPAIAGATLLQFVDAAQAGFPDVVVVPYGIGGGLAFVVGLGALAFFRWVMKHARLELFGWYGVGVGMMTVIASVLV